MKEYVSGEYAIYESVTMGYLVDYFRKVEQCGLNLNF